MRDLTEIVKDRLQDLKSLRSTVGRVNKRQKEQDKNLHTIISCHVSQETKLSASRIVAVIKRTSRPGMVSGTVPPLARSTDGSPSKHSIGPAGAELIVGLLTGNGLGDMVLEVGRDLLRKDELPGLQDIYRRTRGPKVIHPRLFRNKSHAQNAPSSQEDEHDVGEKRATPAQVAGERGERARKRRRRRRRRIRTIVI